MKNFQRTGSLRTLAITSALALALAACSGENDNGTVPGASGAPAKQAQAEAPAAQGAATQPAQHAKEVAAVPAAKPLQQPAVDEHANELPAATPAPAEENGGSLIAKQSKDKARLDVDSSEFDFGNSIEGERLTHTFKLSSTGGADLIINSAKPTCGCTVAKLALVNEDGETEVYEMGDPLPPGTELELTARLDTKNKHNVASSKINIFCNDPRQTVTLGLKTLVDTYFQITPSSLQFGELSVAEEASQSFTVTGKKPGAFKLSTEGHITPPGMTVELVPDNPDENGRSEHWTVNVSLGEGTREGNLGYPIQIRSDQEVSGAQRIQSGEMPTYGATVMATARIRGLISWEPQYLSFGLVRPGQVLARSFDVASYDENFTFDSPGLRIVGPNDQKPDFPWADHFSVVSRPSEDGKAIKVELTLNGLPEEAQGSFQGRVIVETGHPAKPEIPVLFSGVCRPGVVATPKVGAGTGGG